MKHLFRLVCALTAACCAVADGPWQQAKRGWRLNFPQDHGSHPQHRIEWWYFTGNLDSAGRRFGYQLTFFRIGVDAVPQNPSRWAVRDLHMAHFAISDLGDEKFHPAQRLGRAGPGFCGAAPEKLKVWQEDWSAEMLEDGTIRLKADAEAAVPISLNLNLKPQRPPVAHGEDGYSRKGQMEGNASIYYSLTRLETRGSLTIDGTAHPVTGLSWMDHEFGTSFLEPDQQGWDWISLQLSDGSDLMIYRLRKADAAAKGILSGTLVAPDGRVEHLGPEDVSLVPGETWTSPRTKANYPVKWQVRCPRHGLELEISTTMPAQEMQADKQQAGPIYWEGAIDASGTRGGQPVAGRGYLEMTGYSGRGLASFFALPEGK